MKPKKNTELVRDVVEYTPPTPHGRVQALALARVQNASPAPQTKPPPFHTPQEIIDFAVRWIAEHGRSSAQEICQELYGVIDDSKLRTVGNCLALRKRSVGDLSYSRVRTKVPGQARTLWFPVQPVVSQGITLKDLADRLDRLEAQQDRVLRVLAAIFKTGEWPE